MQSDLANRNGQSDFYVLALFAHVAIEWRARRADNLSKGAEIWKFFSIAFMINEAKIVACQKTP